MIQVARMDNHHSTTLVPLNYDNELFPLSGEYEDVLHGRKRKKKSDDLFSPVTDHQEHAGMDEFFAWQMWDKVGSSESECQSWLTGESLSSASEDADNLLPDDLFPSVETPEAQLDDFNQAENVIGHGNAVLKEVSMAINPLCSEMNKPHRMRKRSISQTLAWYQSSRKRKVSLTACSPSRARNLSVSESSRVKNEVALLEYATGSSELSESGTGRSDYFTSKNNMEDFVTLHVGPNVKDKDGLSELQGEHGSIEAELADMIPEGYAIYDIDGLLWDHEISKLFDEDDEGNVDIMQKSRKLDMDNEHIGVNMFSDIFESFNMAQEPASCVSTDNKSNFNFGPSSCEFDSEKNVPQFNCRSQVLHGTFPGQSKLCSDNVDFEAESVHRRPGRPRKKSISQSVAWYRSHRKRQTSLSSVSNASYSQEAGDSNQAMYQRRLSARIARRGGDVHRCTTGSRTAKRNRDGRKSKCIPKKKWSPATPVDGHKRYMWEHSSNDSGYEVDYTSTTTVSCESDDDDAIVDVVTVSTMINERPNDAFSPTNLKAMVGLINAWHCYCSPMSLATQRALAKASSRETKFKLVLSPERRNSASTIDCSVPTSRSLTTSRKNRSRRREARDRVTDEQRVKREALNDLERNRRREMTRELTSLRVVVPGVRDNPRAPKVTILDSAAHHIRFLERLLARNEALLAEQHQKMAELKALC